MPTIPRDEPVKQLAQFSEPAQEKRYQCANCGSLHHYKPQDKKGCRRCTGPLIEFSVNKNPDLTIDLGRRSKRNESKEVTRIYAEK